MNNQKMMVAACVAICLSVHGGAVRDALVAPDLKDTRVQGPIGAKFDQFIHERCLSDFARNVIVRARGAE